MAAASPNNDKELLAKAPIISQITKTRNDTAVTLNRKMLDNLNPQNSTGAITLE